MIRSLFACAALAISAPVVAHDIAPDPAEETAHPEARLYDASIDASAAVDAALARAAERHVNVLVVLGANWCHDSRAFAGWMETPRFRDLVARRYELVYVNVGMPQTGDGHNLHIPRRFGLDEIEGTPTVLLLSDRGELMNKHSAGDWRDTASRDEDAIFEELALMATTEIVRE